MNEELRRNSRGVLQTISTRSVLLGHTKTSDNKAFRDLYSCIIGRESRLGINLGNYRGPFYLEPPWIASNHHQLPRSAECVDQSKPRAWDHVLRTWNMMQIDVRLDCRINAVSTNASCCIPTHVCPQALSVDSVRRQYLGHKLWLRIIDLSSLAVSYPSAAAQPCRSKPCELRLHT